MSTLSFLFLPKIYPVSISVFYYVNIELTELLLKILIKLSEGKLNNHGTHCILPQFLAPSPMGPLFYFFPHFHLFFTGYVLKLVMRKQTKKLLMIILEYFLLYLHYHILFYSHLFCYVHIPLTCKGNPE